MAIETIKNRYPDVGISVTLTTPIISICPHSHEPQVGSSISVTYSPKEELIELHSVEKFLRELSRGKDAIDLETVCQLLFMACKEVGILAHIKATYKLNNGLEMTCESRS